MPQSGTAMGWIEIDAKEAHFRGRLTLFARGAGYWFPPARTRRHSVPFVQIAGQLLQLALLRHQVEIRVGAPPGRIWSYALR
jgi:hypothetical protein